MDTNDRFVNRKVVRLQNYDYTTSNAYFITICTKDKACILGSTTSLSPIGKLAAWELTDIPRHHPEVLVEKYVIMPNHIHAILRLDSAVDQRLSIPQIVALYKSAVSRSAKQQLWQRSFYEHTIRNQDEYLKIWKYIDENPIKWEMDRFFIGCH